LITVVIESPLSGAAFADRFVRRRRGLVWLWALLERVGRWRNRRYACACMRDCLARGEAPYASHLLFNQGGILDDADSYQRSLGMQSGFAHGRLFDLRAVYVDRGVSGGMLAGITEAQLLGQTVERRSLKGRG
jgi:hypothetical protein